MRHYRSWAGTARSRRGQNGAVTSGPVASAADRPAPRVQTALDGLRSRGERVTPARRAVLQVLDATADHLTAEEIVARGEQSAPGVHRATVYRALATLGELGLITHTHLGGSAAVYHLAGAPNPAPGEPTSHAHLQCTRCLAVIDVPVDALTELAARLEGDVGFELQPEHAALLGLCADCRSGG
jgi:Fur family ferric uptake transcriptional regulator